MAVGVVESDYEEWLDSRPPRTSRFLVFCLACVVCVCRVGVCTPLLLMFMPLLLLSRSLLPAAGPASLRVSAALSRCAVVLMRWLICCTADPKIQKEKRGTAMEMSTSQSLILLSWLTRFMQP